ncbi:MAG: tetratricopeptide repeat protein, partial [Planctomycetota bacterium]
LALHAQEQGERLFMPSDSAAQSVDSDALEQAEQAFLQGVMHFTHEEIAMAISALDESLSLNPLGMEARLLRGICHLKTGDVKKAGNDFDLYVNGDVDKCENLNVVGKLLYMYGFFEDAEGKFRQALNLNAQDPVVHSNLGSVLIESRRWKEAEACFLKAMEIDPEFADAYENLGILYFITEDFSAAETVFLRAIELNEAAEIKDSLPYANLGDLYFATGYTSACIDAYETALGIEPEMSSLRTRLGMAWQMKGEADLARDQFELAISYGNEPPEAHSQLAQFLVREGRIFEAISEYRRAIQVSQHKDPEILIELGTILVRMERMEEALALFQEAYRLGDQSPAVLGSLSRLFELTGREEESKDYFVRLMQQDRESILVLIEIAQRCADSRIEGIFDPAAAVRIGDQIATDMGWYSPGVMRIMARAYEQLGDHAKAVKAQQHVIASIPESTPLTHSMRSRLEEYLLRME